MNTKILVSAVIASTVCVMSGCSMMMPSPMTNETAQEIIKRNETYEPNSSFAYNICRYTASSNGDYSCQKDVTISREEYNKMFGADVKGDSGDFATSLALYSLPALVNSSAFFGSFDNWGPGALLLVSDILKPEGDKTNNRFVAFVPVSKAKTQEEAINYVYDSFAKAYRGMFKKYGFKESDYTKNFITLKFGEQVVRAKGLAVTDNNGCDRYKNEEGNMVDRCYFFNSSANSDLNGVEMTIPSWMPNAGEKAWVIKGMAYFKTKDGYTGDLNQRKLVIDEAKGLPDNFYLLQPETYEGSPLKGFDYFPAFVASNKGLYFYVVPKD